MTTIGITKSQSVNSLAPGGFENIFQNVFFKLISWIDTLSNSCETALRSMPQNPSDDKSTLVQVMAWCRQAASHYLSQCCPRSLSPYGVTRPQWVNTVLWKIRAHGAKFKLLIIHDNITYMKFLLCSYSPISNVQFFQSSWQDAGNHDILFPGSSGCWGPLEAASGWAENVWPPIGGFLDNDIPWEALLRFLYHPVQYVNTVWLEWELQFRRYNTTKIRMPCINHSGLPN